MDKASAPGAGDSRFESWAEHRELGLGLGTSDAKSCTDFCGRMVLPTGFKTWPAGFDPRPGRASGCDYRLRQMRWAYAWRGASDPGKPTATIHAHVHAHLCTNGPLQQVFHMLEVILSLYILLIYFLIRVSSEGPLA